MLSELIHNPFVNEDLLAQGLRYLQTDKGLPLRADGSVAGRAGDSAALWNQLTDDDIVVIPAFGATNEDKVRLIVPDYRFASTMPPVCWWKKSGKQRGVMRRRALPS